jgi:hypothetical protein
MRRTFIAVRLIFVSSSVSVSLAQGQTNTVRTALEKTIFGLENDWTKGLVARDTILFRRITDPKFVYTEDSAMMTREDVIRGVASGPKVEYAANQGMQLHDFSPAAIVTGILVVRTREKTGAHTTRYRFTDTWLNKNGKWVIIGAQDYVIPNRSSK